MPRAHTIYGEESGGLVVDPIGPLADALATHDNAAGESDEPIEEL